MTAYQAAVAEGDLRDALPHGQRAYTLLENQPEETEIDVASLAADIGHSLNQLTEYSQAKAFLDAAIPQMEQRGAVSDALRYRINYEHAISMIGTGHITEALDEFTTLLSLADMAFGVDSAQSSTAHLYLAIIPLLPNFVTVTEDHELFDYPSLVGTNGRYSEMWISENRDTGIAEISATELDQVRGHLDYVERLNTGPLFDATVDARIALLRAAIRAQEPRSERASRLYKEAIDHLIAIHYADTFVLALAKDWLVRAVQWNDRQREIAGNIDRIARLARCRSEGEQITIVRGLPVYPRSAIVRGNGGTVLVQYDIDVDGSVENVRVIQSAGRDLDGAVTNALEDALCASDARRHSGANGRN